MAQPVIGVIGGSGLYEIEGLNDVREVKLETPFGDPSDTYVTGFLGGAKMVFLPRHGRGHRLLPSEVNYRANIYGMKTFGVEYIISVSAVGSMKEEIVPGHIVIPDQFFDRTQGKRASTFFGEGVVGHVQFADPEAEICYGTVALATDYDCWYEDHDDVSVDAVIAIIQQNVATARNIIQAATAQLVKRQQQRACPCAEALKFAIMTDKGLIPNETKKKLEPILGKYL